MTDVDHVRRRYRVAVARLDALCDALWRDGTRGLHVEAADDPFADPSIPAGHARVDAYFALDAPPAARAAAIVGAELLDDAAQPAEDWLAAYRQHAQPIDVGRGFRIDPRDPDDPSIDAAVDRASARAAGRRLLHIPAQRAFGTGSHASTRLVLAWLEDLDLPRRAVLDVGCGSGILCFVALALGARRAVGFDVDPASPLIARVNAQRNRDDLADRRPTFFAGRLDALRASVDGGFDLAAVNVLPERIAPDLPALRALLAPRADVLNAGNLVADRARDEARWRDLGFAVVETRVEDPWIAYRLRAT
ncbi:MAG: 50S ribosomal protein L11 methyltransferase [Acidobacteriota bacterium]